jgi:hypothetical protein
VTNSFESSQSTLQHILSFLEYACHQDEQGEKSRNSNDHVRLVPTTLRLMLAISHTGQELNYQWGKMGLVEVIIGIMNNFHQ